MAVRFVLSWAFNRRPVLFGPFSFALFRDFKDNRVRYGSYAFSWDFKDKGGRFCFVTRFHWRPVMLGYAISVTVGFFSVMCFQNTAGFVPSLFYEISNTKVVGFVRLWDLNGGWLCSVMTFQKTASFVSSLSHEVSKPKAVGFFPSRDFTDRLFYSVTSSQWRLALFCREVYVRYCSFDLLLDFEDNRGRYGSYALLRDLEDIAGRVFFVTGFHWRRVLLLRSLTRFRRS